MYPIITQTGKTQIR